MLFKKKRGGKKKAEREKEIEIEGRAGRAGRGGEAEDEAEDEEKIGKSRFVSEEKILADVERIKANIEALNELRKVNDERFSRTTEQIGELRSMIIGVEKDLKELEAEASKAIDAVKSTRPEKLLEEVSRVMLKTDALSGKIDSQQAVINKVIEELKDLREKFSLFRSLEEIMNLNKEMKENIAKYKKLQGKLERDADRIESIFIEVNKKFEDFIKYKEMFLSSEDRLKTVEKLIDKLSVKSETLLSIDVFNDFKRKTGVQIESIDKRQGEIEKETEKIVENAFKKEVEPFKKTLNNKYSQLTKKFDEKINESEKLKEEVLNYLKRMALIEGNVKKFISENSEIMKEIENDKEILAKQIAEIKDLRIKEYVKKYTQTQDEIQKQIEMLSERLDETNRAYLKMFENFTVWIDYFNKRLDSIINAMEFRVRRSKEE